MLLLSTLLPFHTTPATSTYTLSLHDALPIYILTLLYMRQSAGFQEIRRGLGRISSRVLSSKLTRMQETGLIRRDVKPTRPPDRKSTRLNSSHTVISYAVFCLKKKKMRQTYIL